MTIQRFSYPVTRKVPSSGGAIGTATFTFPAVPIGLTWIGNFMPCLPGNPQGSTLAAVAWEIMRNGQPEISWIGYTVLENFTATGGDVISITAFNLPPTASVTITWQGWSQDDADPYVPIAPTLATSGDLGPLVGASLKVADDIEPLGGVADGQVIINLGTGFLQCWELSFNVSSFTGAAGTEVSTVTFGHFTGGVMDTILAQIPFVSGPNNNYAMSEVIDLKGVTFPVAGATTSFGVAWTGFSGVASAFTSWVMFYANV